MAQNPTKSTLFVTRIKAGNGISVTPESGTGIVTLDVEGGTEDPTSITGGIKIGTSSGGTQIAAAITVNASSFTRTLPGSLTTSGPFSPTAAQTIYIQAVVAWNSANVNIIIPLKRALQ